MALGKRKRRYQVSANNELQDQTLQEDDDNLQALFRQHFEAKFRPLEAVAQLVPEQPLAQSPLAGVEDSSDWDGLTDGEDHGPEIVEHDPSLASCDELPAEELKSFMGARPPSTIAHLPSTAKTKGKQAEDVEESASDATNLKKDLELQRLLKESHLLDSQASLSVTGKNRHKALDLRLQDLGSKSSVYAQHKMPMAHRKGIAAKATEKEGVRRREAQENGIILEKATKSRKVDAARRERGIGTPSVGKFQGGMLKLSWKDVADIQGPKKQTMKRRR